MNNNDFYLEPFTSILQVEQLEGVEEEKSPKEESLDSPHTQKQQIQVP